MREDLIEMGRDIDSLYPLLQYVAIGTIADLAKLNEINRPLVRQLPQTITKKQAMWVLGRFFDKNDRTRSFFPLERISFSLGFDQFKKGSIIQNSPSNS